MNEKNVIYACNRILFGLGKEILTSVTTQKVLEDIMLGDISQSQKTG